MNRNSLIYVLAAAIVLLLIGLFVVTGSNSKNRNQLNTEKVTNEKLLSEKLSLENQLTKLLADLNTLKDRSSANEQMLSDTQAKLAENERKVNTLNGENKSLRASRQELADLKNTRELLEKEYSQLKSENERLIARGNELQNSINSLESDKKEITSNLEKTKMYSTDNFLVTATRGNKTEKIVICASRTKKLNITFEVPQSLSETISFKIVTPAGTTINPDDKSLTWYVPLDSRNYTASLSSISGEFEESRQVILSYSAKTKLVKGEYKIQILSNGNNIGNCRIMLK